MHGLMGREETNVGRPRRATPGASRLPDSGCAAMRPGRLARISKRFAEVTLVHCVVCSRMGLVRHAAMSSRIALVICETLPGRVVDRQVIRPSRRALATAPARSLTASFA